MTPRVRRFLLLLLALAAWAAFVHWAPDPLFKWVVLLVLGGLLLYTLWQLAALPFPWRLPWRRP